jgi:outer membrane protein OmpA-like peptidoglycan-associated protein
MGKLAGLLILTCASAFAANVKGIIISRTGNTLMVRSGPVTKIVVLNDSTRTKDDRGLFGLRKEELANTVLIPGLKVDVDGTADNEGRVTAETITVDGDDLETAQMIQSGMHPTAEQVAANMKTLEEHQQSIAGNQENIAQNKEDIDKLHATVATKADKQQVEQNIREIQEVNDRFSSLDDYAVKGEATVKFDVGSSDISSADMEQLSKLAQTATGIDGYMVEVKGYADSTGNALMNEKLSEDRAKRVVAFLVQRGNIPVWRIMAPGAMGEYQPAASNETQQGRAENRRVVVKILVNKGVAGKG